MEPKRHFLIAALVTGGLIFIYGPGALRWIELQVQHLRLESEITALQRENHRLYLEARRLREDPSYAEAVARRELGFVRPGETVVKVQDPKTASSAKPQSSRRQSTR